MKHILLIDDNHEYIQSLQTVLEAYGYEVDTAMNGAIGCRKFAEGDYDAVITDIYMPEMDGLEVVRTLRSENKSTLLVATCGGGSWDIREALKTAKLFGATTTLEKPFSIDDLLEIID